MPTLWYKILHDLPQWQWHVGRPYRAKSVDALRKNLRCLLWNASAEKNCGALLVLLDLDDGCSVDSVEKLAQEIRALNLVQPVAIVFALTHHASPTNPPPHLHSLSSDYPSAIITNNYATNQLGTVIK